MRLEPHVGTSALRRNALAPLSLLFAMGRHSERTAVCKTEREPLQPLGLPDINLRLSANRSVRNKHLLFKQPSAWPMLQQPELTRAVYFTTIFKKCKET